MILFKVSINILCLLLGATVAEIAGSVVDDSKFNWFDFGTALLNAH